MNARVPKPRVRVKAISAPIALPAKRQGPESAFMRGNTGPIFSQWRPALRETRDDVRAGYQAAASRTIDLIQNSGFISGMVDQAVVHVVGSGLRLNARPDAESLGMTTKEASDWARIVEAKFNLWADRPIDCDAESRKTFGHMQATAFRAWLGFGEIAAALPTFLRQGGEKRSKVLVLPASRITLESNPLRGLHSGVFLDSYGASIGYQISDFDKFGSKVVRDVSARYGNGRQSFVHVFDGMPGQVRGISPFAPVLAVARRFDQLNDATLTSALLRAVFAATVEATEPTTDFMTSLLTREEQAKAQSRADGYFDATSAWLDNVDINLGINGRISHLFPGQKLTFHESTGAGPDYKAFISVLLREIARCAGLTYESATGDYSDASYASINNGMTDLFGVTLYRRKNLVAPFCQASFEAWLDESIFDQSVPFPGGYGAFLTKRAAACRAIWKGAGRPKADEIKTAKAHEIWARLGVMTDEMIASELGVDIEDVYEQRKREQDMRAEYGLRESFVDPNDKLTNALVAQGG